MNNGLNSIPCPGYDCECMECQAALLKFLWDYLLCCEHLSTAECLHEMQSQFRSMDKARRILNMFSRQLAGGTIIGEVDVRKVLQLVNSCGFCQRMVKKWNKAAEAKLY